MRFWRMKQALKVYEMRMTKIRKAISKADMFTTGKGIIEGKDYMDLLALINTIWIEATRDKPK